jgi:hypothetical protein|tara:strand:+ start:68760 stop:69278 length:519 start_codon:yes stop_codon:yes gene_type:complete
MKHLLTIFTFFSFISINLAQEHPSEHPKEHPVEHPAEHPAEHPVKLSTVAVTKDNLADAVTRFVKEESKKTEGVFQVNDEEKEEVLSLALQKIHKDRLANLGDNTYFVCADFETPKGKVYDIDIFMEGASADSLKPVEISVHKEEGVERYTWMEVEGIWHKVAVEEESDGKQ